MDLQEINVWSVKAGEGRIDSVKYCSVRQARLVRILG